MCCTKNGINKEMNQSQHNCSFELTHEGENQRHL